MIAAMEMTVSPQSKLNGGGNSRSTTQEVTAPPSSSSFEEGGASAGAGGEQGSSSMRGISSEDEPAEGGHMARRRNSLPGGFSGLSALIQAATSQLGHLIDSDSAQGGDGGNLSGSPVSLRHRTAQRRQSWHPPPSPPSYGPSSSTQLVSRSPSRERTQLRLKDLRGGTTPATGTGGTSTTTATSNDLTENGATGRDTRRIEPTSPPTAPSLKAPEPDPNKQSFPELLMALCLNPANADIITFLPDGKFFAVRSRQFAESIMARYVVAASTLEEFLELAGRWGFSRILSHPDAVAPRDIEVFRHPYFVKGDWNRCSRITFGETPTHARVSALPEMSRIVSASSATSGGETNDNNDPNHNTSDAASPRAVSSSVSTPPTAAAATPDASNSCSGSNTKRRLSPGFLHRAESESSVTSQKLRMRSPGGPSAEVELDAAGTPAPSTITTERRRESTDSESELISIDRLPSPTTAKVDELRSLALSITTEKLKLKCDDAAMEEAHSAADNVTESSERPSPAGKGALVDRAVESATHTIVTDAIETLLRDEGHTKITYLKHERELSVSSIPGVVPISKQLFSPDAASSSAVAAAAAASATTTSRPANHGGGRTAMLPLSVPEPAEITPPLQPKNSESGVPETPLDVLSGTSPPSMVCATFVPKATPPNL